jgi:hypothetical protein
LEATFQEEDLKSEGYSHGDKDALSYYQSPARAKRLDPWAVINGFHISLATELPLNCGVWI